MSTLKFFKNIKVKQIVLNVLLKLIKLIEIWNICSPRESSESESYYFQCLGHVTLDKSSWDTLYMYYLDTYIVRGLIHYHESMKQSHWFFKFTHFLWSSSDIHVNTRPQWRVRYAHSDWTRISECDSLSRGNVSIRTNQFKVYEINNVCFNDGIIIINHARARTKYNNNAYTFYGCVCFFFFGRSVFVLTRGVNFWSVSISPFFLTPSRLIDWLLGERKRYRWRSNNNILFVYRDLNSFRLLCSFSAHLFCYDKNLKEKFKNKLL